MLRYDDAKNRISGYDTTVNGTSYSTDYIYGENNNSPEAVTGIKRNGERVISYNYDDLGRLNTRTLATTTPFVTEYSYAYGKTKYGESYEAKFTTPLVETVKNGNDRTGDGSLSLSPRDTQAGHMGRFCVFLLTFTMREDNKSSPTK